MAINGDTLKRAVPVPIKIFTQRIISKFDKTFYLLMNGTEYSLKALTLFAVGLKIPEIWGVLWPFWGS